MLSNLKVQEAYSSDYEWFLQVFSRVEALHREFLPWKYKKTDIFFSKQEFEDILIWNNAKIFIAKYNQQIVWIVLAFIKEAPNKPILQKRKYIEIDTICVLEKFEWQWIWKKLLNTIEQRWNIIGIQDIQLNVWLFNKSAVDFYIRNWYHTVSSIMRKEL